MDITNGNQKLITSLRIGLENLKKDVSDANGIIASIKNDNAPLEIISAEDTKKTLTNLNEIKNAINEISKTGVNTDAFKQFIKDISSNFDNLETKIKGMTPVITETFNASGKDALDMAGNVNKAASIVSTSWDVSGKKVVETLKAVYDEEQKISGYNAPTSKVTTDDASAELSKISMAYQKLQIDGKASSESLSGLATEVEKVTTDYNLQGSALEKAQGQQLSYVNGVNAMDAAEAKLAASTERQSLATLKSATEEQSTSSQYDQMSKTLARISGEQEALAMSSSNASNNMMSRMKISTAYAIAAQSIYMVRQAFTDAIQTNISYEASLVDLKRVLVDVSSNDLAAYGAQAIQLAKDYGEPLAEIQSTYSALAAAGVQTKADLNSMANTISLGLNTSDITDGAQLTQLLTSSMKQLGIATSDSESVLDSWNYLADKHIAKTSDFAEATSKAGMASKAMGMDINDLNATVAVLSDTTGASGTQIGDAIKSMETKLETPKALATMKQYGIEVMADATHFKSFSDIIGEVSTTLNKFGDNTTQSNDILTALGGTMRRNWVTILAQSQSKIDTVSQTSAIDSIGYSATKSSATMDTLAKRIQVFNANVKEFYLSLGEGGLGGQLKGIVGVGSMALGALSKFGGLLLTIGEVTLAVKGLSGGLKILTDMNLTQWLDKIDLGHLNIGGADFGGATTSIKAYESAASTLSDEITKGNISFKESQTILGVVGEKIGLATTSTNTYKASEIALNDVILANESNEARATVLLEELNTQKVASSVSTDGAAASERALDAVQKTTAESAWALKLAEIGITLGFTALVSGLVALVSYMSQAEQAQTDLLQSGADAAKTNDDESKSIQSLVSQYQTLATSGNTDADTKKQLTDLQTKLISSFGDEGKQINIVNGAYKDQIDVLQKLSKQKADDYLATNKTADDTAISVLGATGNSTAQASSGSRVASMLDNTKGVSVHTGAEGFGDIKGYYDINGTLEQRVKILKDILDGGNNITGQTDAEKKSLEGVSAQYKTLNAQLTAAKTTVQTMYSNQLTSQYSDQLEKMTKDAAAYQTAMNTGDKGGAKKASDDFNAVFKSMDKITGASPEMNAAFKIFTNGFNMTAGAAKDAAKQIELTAAQVKVLTDSFDASQDNISTYNKLMLDYRTNGKFSAESVKEIIDKHQELAGYLNDEPLLYKKMAEALNKEKDTANNAYAQMMTSSDGYYKTNIAGTDIIKKALGKYWGDLTVGQQKELENSKNLADAKLKVEAALIGAVSLLWAKYTEAQAEVVSSLPEVKTGNSIDDGRRQDLEDKLTAKSVKGAAALRGIAASSVDLYSTQAAIDASFNKITANIKAPTMGDYGADTSSGTQTNATKVAAANAKAQAAADKKQAAADAAQAKKDQAAKVAADKKAASDQAKADKTQNAADIQAAKISAAQAAVADGTASASQAKLASGATSASDLAATRAKTAADLAYNNAKKVSDLMIAGYQKQIDAITAKVATETRATQQLKYQNDLLKEQNDLSTANNEKNVRIYENGKWQWEADQTVVKTATDALTATQTEFAQWKVDNANTDKIAGLNAQIKTEQDKQTARDTAHSALGYDTGTDNATPGIHPINEKGIEIIAGNQANFQGGEKVINASDTQNLLTTSSGISGKATSMLKSDTKTSLSTVGQSVTDNNKLVTNPVTLLLNSVDDSVQRFIDASPKYSKEFDGNIGQSVKDNDKLIKVPVANLVSDINNSLQKFVDFTPNYGKGTDKNIGDAITANSNLMTIPMTTVIGYVQSGIEEFVASNYTQGTDMIDEMGKGITDSTKKLTDIVTVLTTKVIAQFRTDLGIKSPSVAMYKIGDFMMQGLANGISSKDIGSFIQSQFDGMAASATSAFSGNGGAVSGSLVQWITEAMKATGVDPSNLGALETIAMHESSGDPNSINLWDSNAKAGHPSQGLMQMIPSTYLEHAMPGKASLKYIDDPVANIESAIRYMESRYNGINNVPGIKSLKAGGPYIGYGEGTNYVPQTGEYMVGEHGVEKVILQQGSQVVPHDKINIPTINVPKFDMPDINMNMPSSTNSGKGDTIFKIDHIILPDVNDGAKFMSSLITFSKTH